MKRNTNVLKIVIGFIVSLFFLYLAFRQLDFSLMKNAFSVANYWLLIPSVIVIFLSHWLRSIRWQLLLNPIKQINANNLFTALLIGYSANTILPAHLGEFIRAYIISREKDVSLSSVMATIIVERIIDVLSIVLIMAFTVFVFPFPAWVKQSGYILLLFSIGLIFFLILSKKYTESTVKIISVFLKPFPQKLKEKILNIFYSFLAGFKSMKSKKDYLIIIILSFLIWLSYWSVFYINFYTFNLINDFNLDITAGLVILVITTISVIVPSSPGYIGTYHWLCQFSLELFAVPRAMGLSYAIVLHAVNFFPVFIVGIILAWKEGISFTKSKNDASYVKAEVINYKE